MSNNIAKYWLAEVYWYCYLGVLNIGNVDTTLKCKKLLNTFNNCVKVSCTGLLLSLILVGAFCDDSVAFSEGVSLDQRDKKSVTRQGQV